jgi:lipopolysaccharide/colanic/teichoic acid biosynthesis glycosyltransferase
MAGGAMTASKRAMDIVLALLIGVLASVPFVVIALLLLREGRPVFYVSERMKAPAEPFALFKFRTMRGAAQNGGVSGGNKAGRITPMGRVLRRARLDEIPQLWNILRGDMSFVGPRPPLRIYVERFPDLYAQVLRSRPGVTGLASLYFHNHEDRLLSHCKTAEETDAVYARRCIPRKARLDLIYQRKRNLCLDLAIIGQTFGRVLAARLFRR